MGPCQYGSEYCTSQHVEASSIDGVKTGALVDQPVQPPNVRVPRPQNRQKGAQTNPTTTQITNPTSHLQTDLVLIKYGIHPWGGGMCAAQLLSACIWALRGVFALPSG